MNKAKDIQEGNKLIVKCNECGKIVNGRMPKGGDGSLWLPKWHKNNEGKPCSGRFEEGIIVTNQNKTS